MERHDRNPLVSIVTPSLNQGRFLRRTIDSVLGQDYPRIEYLVRDGASTDDSIDILSSYGSRLAWQSCPDAGQSDAINQGLAQATGDILAYLNSDDVLLPGAVAKVVAHFESNAGCDVVYGRAFHIDEQDRILEPYPTTAFSLKGLLENCFICQPATFWRRRIAERVGPFDARLHYAMDLDYWLRIAGQGGRFDHLAEFLACSRLHENAKTLAHRAEVYREIFDVSLRHAGGAGLSHYVAYWHHRLHERPTGWPRLLRRLPRAAYWLGVIHSRWHKGFARSP